MDPLSAQAPNPTTPIRPSLYHCLWSLPFLFAGIGFFVYALLHGLTHFTDGLTQVVVPGSAQLNLRHGLTYTVFLEEESTVHGKIYSTKESLSGLECRVTSIPAGTSIPVRTSSLNTTYSVNSRSGHSVLEFQIDQDGPYRFACDYGSNPRGPDTVLAVGSGTGGAFAISVLESIGSLAAGFACAIAVFLFVLLKREREKKNLWQLGQPYGD